MSSVPGLTLGMKGKAEILVGEEHTAPKVGSGRVHVLATPVMINLIEAAALAAVEHLLPAGQQSLGTHLDVRHFAATPVGMRVAAEAELVKIDGRLLTFRVSAADAIFQPGETGFNHYTLGQMFNVLNGAYTRGILNSLDDTWVAIVAGLAAALALLGVLTRLSKNDRAPSAAGLAIWLALPVLAIWFVSRTLVMPSPLRKPFGNRWWRSSGAFLALVAGSSNSETFILEKSTLASSRFKAA